MRVLARPAAVVVAGSSLLVSFGFQALYAQSPWQARSFDWSAATVVVAPDSLRGVFVAAMPAEGRHPTYLGRFRPEAVLAWTMKVDSVLESDPKDEPIVGLRGADSALIAFQFLRKRGPRLIFDVPAAQGERAQYAVELSAKQLRPFSEAFATAAMHAGWREGTTIVSQDSLGKVFWCDPGDSTVVPVRMRNAPTPRYPSGLHNAGIAGVAWLTYVVSPEGRAEPETINVVFTTHPEFGKAAREAVLEARFDPGRYRSRAVRVGVLQLFNFRISDPQ